MSANEHRRQTESGETSDNWAERVPCPDESCIGTMGPDGRCRVCGQQGEAAPDPGEDSISAPPETVNAESDAGEVESAQTAGDEADSLESEAAAGDDDWEQRRLCPDESCIGTMGRDGRCRVCGRSDRKE